MWSAPCRTPVRACTTNTTAPPTLEEISRRPASTRRVLAALEAPAEAVSLDRPVGEDGDASLQDFVEDATAVDPEARAAAAWRRDRLIKALQILDPEEQQVLWLRFGLDGDEPWTLSDVGKVINSTRERVRQIEARGVGQTAPSQLRHRPAGPALTVADDERVVAHAAHDRAPFPLCADTSAGTSSSKRLLSRNTDSHFAAEEPEADYLGPLISLECEEIGFLVPTFGAGESDGKIHH